MLEHRIAKLAAGATFLLLIIGGIVNATGSGLACPEPTLMCHGEVFPRLTAFDGVLYEHGHRLAAMSVGLLQIGLTILLVTHDLPLVRRHAQQVIWLHEGKVRTGTAAELLRPEHLAEVLDIEIS